MYDLGLDLRVVTYRTPTAFRTTRGGKPHEPHFQNLRSYPLPRASLLRTSPWEGIPSAAFRLRDVRGVSGARMPPLGAASTVDPLLGKLHSLTTEVHGTRSSPKAPSPAPGPPQSSFPHDERIRMGTSPTRIVVLGPSSPTGQMAVRQSRLGRVPWLRRFLVGAYAEVRRGSSSLF